MADSKNWVFQFRQFSIFFSRISWIGSWVSRIDWCERHWCGSTYMVERLSNVSSKTGKKCNLMITLVYSKRVSVRNNLLHSVFQKVRPVLKTLWKNLSDGNMKLNWKYFQIEYKKKISNCKWQFGTKPKLSTYWWDTLHIQVHAP